MQFLDRLEPWKQEALAGAERLVRAKVSTELLIARNAYETQLLSVLNSFQNSTDACTVQYMEIIGEGTEPIEPCRVCFQS